jgi:hypothetical protein
MLFHPITLSARRISLDATGGMRHATAMTNHEGFIGETIAAWIICR